MQLKSLKGLQLTNLAGFKLILPFQVQVVCLNNAFKISKEGTWDISLEQLQILDNVKRDK